MKKAAALTAAWLPFAALWVIFAMENGATFGFALPRALFAIGSAALLGLAVARVVEAMPWPRELRAGFYGVQVIAAFAYAATWDAAMIAFNALLDGRLAPRTLMIGWFLEGVWLYAIIAGVAYAMQTQRRALEAEKSLSVARLDALRSRLHPHFLFNALHTVGALVRHDAAEAESAVEKLGDMLRYTLREGDGDLVPFAEEWEFTRRYLDFEQLRYGERLRVVSDIDPRSLACGAPSFALQTLVENSVRHSISRRAEGGSVEISARVGDERLHIRVRDVAAAAPVAEATAEAAVATPSQSGYGLTALRQRLETVYGSRLNVSRNEAGFEVSFSIPCARIDDDE